MKIVILLSLAFLLFNFTSTQNNSSTNGTTNDVTITPTSNSTSGSTTSGNTLQDQMDYCNSLNETMNPAQLDCTSINQKCCFASYAIRVYRFKLCFFNTLESNADAKSLFEYKIGSIAESPFIQYEVYCRSTFLKFLPLAMFGYLLMMF